MTSPRLALLILGAMALSGPAARAQAFDCAKATSPVERAICASPVLKDQDRALAQAFSAALAANAGRAAQLRLEQRQWLAERDKLCARPGADPARLTACLVGAYRARLSALGAQPAAQAAAPTPPARPGVTPAAAVPAAATQTPAAVLPSAPTLAPPANLPAASPQGEAALSRETLPGGGVSDLLVTVTRPGRFAIRAESRTGVALQLVDMITGPGDLKGEAGVSDGRIDALLDVGTYKLRGFGAANAGGEAKVTLQPFREAGPASAALVYGGSISTEFGDLEQRSFWIGVPKSGRVDIEAVGRRLEDLKLWRDGVDLVNVATEMDALEPKAGHPMTRARIGGKVEAGLYLATAYGGPGRVWADGDPGQPLHLRTGEPDSLAGGWADGVIGPSGSARFLGPPGAGLIAIELPTPAPVTLKATRGGSSARAAILKNSREPTAQLTVSGGSADAAIVEVTGAEGQPFRLRALDPTRSRSVQGVGPHWLAVDVAGDGGDEPPATALLAAFENGRNARVIAADAPRIGPAQAWRRRMNIRGLNTLLVEATAPMPAAVRAEGVGVRVAIEPLLGNRAPRADGRSPRWELEPGWYVVRLEPLNNAVGVLDLTIGPPGLAAAPQKPGPGRPLIAFGVQSLEKGLSYQIFANTAPGLVIAPRTRALPVDLEEAALTVYQQAGQALDVPVRVPVVGFPVAAEVTGVAVPVQVVSSTIVKQDRALALRLPAPERARAVVLSWSDPATRALDPGADAKPMTRETVSAGAPRFIDLARNQSREFSLEVPEGGLYRVETLGRTRTGLTLATSFVPELDKAEANGAGQNALVQSYLRAGRYRVGVRTSDSAGRVGLVARKASLVESGTLRPEGSVRTTLADGRGAVFGIEIAEAGQYRLEAFGLGRDLRARLEDEDGWPLTAPGELTALERRFEPGRYRLVLLPEPVEARAVIRLTALKPAMPPQGHGPHPLAFDRTQTFQWREPEGRDQPRAPDRWEFALAGPADVTLEIGVGMTGDLVREGQAEPVGKILEKNGFSGRLAAGRYAVEARSLGRNDRLDYTLRLESKELQPGRPRRVTLPTTIPFALAEDRVVNLTTLGRIDVQGVLRDADGRVVERLDDRADDWNIALSRRLPAGSYTLELSEVDAGEAAKVGGSEEEGGATEPEQAEASADDAPQDGDDAEPASTDADESGDADNAALDGDEQVEIRLALPESRDHPALPAGERRQISGPGVHRLSLPMPSADGLLVALAESPAELVLSLERQSADGTWSVSGFERGRAPVVAVPADPAARAWRASVWAIDGGPAPIAIAARELAGEAKAPGRVTLDTFAFEGSSTIIRAARLAAPASGVLALKERADGLLEGSVPGRALAAPIGGWLVPRAGSTWVVSRDPALATLEVEPASLASGEIALTVPAEGRAKLPSAVPEPGRLRVWRAESAFGQPGLSAGSGMGVAQGSALAVAGIGPLQVWNAGSSEPLALRLRASDLKRLDPVEMGAQLASVLPAAAALPVRLAAGRKRFSVDLPAGTAAILGAPGPEVVTIWSGPEAVSRMLDGAWTELTLINPGDAPAPVRASAAPLAAEPARLMAGIALKRFVGAAGSLSIPVDAKPGDRLVVAGAEAVFEGADGRVQRGEILSLGGPGRVTIAHQPGLLAAWIERAGVSPWPAAKPIAVALPGTFPLAGEAMALALTPDTPVLLHARTTAPVILALAREGAADAPVIYPAGAEFHRYLSAGPAELRLFSPHDGGMGGSLELTATPVLPVGEGLGAPVVAAPGGTALFGFEVVRASTIGIGARAEPDRVEVRLLDSRGHSIGEGVAQLRMLQPGRYLVEARVPADGRTTAIRLAVIGLQPPPVGPPPDVAARYLELVGLAPKATP